MSSDDTTGATDHVFLSDYNAAWPGRFEQERARVAAALRTPLCDIVHFGSTAIPGLAAKPVIDLMAPVTTLNDGRRDRVLLRVLGYRPVEADFSRRVLFRRDDGRERLAYHLHLVVCPTWPIKNELLFRDWLIDDPDTVTEYAALKRRLAEACGGDVLRYTEGKTNFVRRIVCKAREVRGLPAETDWLE